MKKVIMLIVAAIILCGCGQNDSNKNVSNTSFINVVNANAEHRIAVIDEIQHQHNIEIHDTRLIKDKGVYAATDVYTTIRDENTGQEFLIIKTATLDEYGINVDMNIVQLK